MQNLQIYSEIDYLASAVELCKETRTGSDGMWQYAPMLCSIPYDSQNLVRLSELKTEIANVFPRLAEFGDKRAAKAFKTLKGSITKPSYFGRIANQRIGKPSQIATIETLINSQPSSGGMAFTVFDPDDLINKFRPGFVPCLIAGSFLIHEDELQLNAFFRSQSVMEFGIQDLTFLRELQANMLASVQDSYHSTSRRNLSLGRLNLHFGRVIIQRRLARYKDVFLHRSEIIDQWQEIVRGFSMP